MTVTITIAGVTSTYATPREAIAAMLAELGNDDLIPLRWLDLVREELRRRTVMRTFDWRVTTEARA